MVKCNRCGLEISDGFDICPNCGNSLNEDTSIETNSINEDGSRRCDECGATLAENILFCPSCGAKVDNPIQNANKTCPNCAGELDDDALFCEHCGYDLTKKRRRKSNNTSFVNSFSSLKSNNDGNARSLTDSNLIILVLVASLLFVFVIIFIFLLGAIIF